MPRFFRLLSLGVVVGIGLISAALQARGTSDDAGQSPMQMLADAVAIDAECGTWNAMFGAIFRFGEAHGIHETDILPLGKRRQEFQAAYNRRLATTDRSVICGSLQSQYHRLFPDWFSVR